MNMANRQPLPVHPLKAFRLRQQVEKPDGSTRPMSQVEMAARYPVAPPVYHSWEMWPEQGGKIPSPDNMRRTAELTNGEVTADDFYRLKDAA
jgi:hypothetical protein